MELVIKNRQINADPRWIVPGLFLFFLGIAFLSNYLILTEEVYTNYYTGQVENDRVREMVVKTRGFNTVKALWAPLQHFITMVGATVCLFVGFMYFDLKISFKDLFKVTMISYLIFVIPTLAKFGYFLLHEPQLLDYNSFAFGSFRGLLSSSDPYWLKSVAETITLFQVLFLLSLAYLISTKMDLSFDNTLKVVLISYGLGLALWLTISIYINMVLFNVQ
jgi:hypothetical protein